jgi:molybdopterin converting factor small subunit
MIEVKVEFLGSFTSELGELNKEVTLPEGATIGDLVEHLTQSLAKGDRFQKMVLDEEGNKQKYVLLMVNYEHLYQEPLDIKIPDKAKVVFAMPVAGG